MLNTTTTLFLVLVLGFDAFGPSTRLRSRLNLNKRSRIYHDTWTGWR
jgi:hypothetical protein